MGVNAIPEGLHVEQELHGAGAFGRVYEVSDERAGKPCTPTRVVRVIEDDSGNAAWKDALLQRVQSLLNLRLPYVATPSEAGVTSDGSVYLVGDLFGTPVSTSIRNDEGLDYPTARDVVGQLLTGLAALHAAGIPHGDVRPQNVYIAGSGETKEATSVWLIDTAISGLTWWSGGELRDSDASYYRPPEWEGKTQKPSTKADLYALGLLIVELLLGRDGNPLRQGEYASAEATWQEVGSRLSARRIPHDFLEIIRVLLAPEGERPADAIEALKRFQASQRRRAQTSWRRSSITAIVAAAILAVVVVISGIANRDVNRQLTELKRTTDQEKAALTTEVERLTTIRDDQRGEISVLGAISSRLKDELADATKTIEEIKSKPDGVEDSPPSPDELAKEWWDKEPHGPLDELGKQEKRIAEGWLNDLRGLEIRAKEWLASDTELKQAHDRAVQQPWDDMKAATDRLDALEEAAEIWRKWANTSDVDFGILGAKVSGRKESVQEILRCWLDEIETRKTWTLRLKSGTAKQDQDLGTPRLVTIYRADDEVAGRGKVHEWKVETKYDYSKDSENRDIPFDWTPGEPIQIILEGDWTALSFGARWNLVDHTVNGPLAVYRLHNEGMIKGDDYDIMLELEIVNCPGPPRSWKKSVPSIIGRK